MKFLPIILFLISILHPSLQADEEQPNIQVENLMWFKQVCIEEHPDCGDTCRQQVNSDIFKQDPGCQDFWSDWQINYPHKNVLSQEMIFRYAKYCIWEARKYTDVLMYKDIYECAYYQLEEYTFNHGKFSKQLPLDFASIFQVENCIEEVYNIFDCKEDCQVMLENFWTWNHPDCQEYLFTKDTQVKNHQLQPSFYSKQNIYHYQKCYLINRLYLIDRDPKKLKNPINILQNIVDDCLHIEYQWDGIYQYQLEASKVQNHMTWDDFYSCERICYEESLCGDQCQYNSKHDFNKNLQPCQDYQYLYSKELSKELVSENYVGKDSAFFLQKCYIENSQRFSRTNPYNQIFTCTGYCLGYDLQYSEYPGTYIAKQPVQNCFKNCECTDTCSTSAHETHNCELFREFSKQQRQDKFVKSGYYSAQSLYLYHLCQKEIKQKYYLFDKDIFYQAKCTEECLFDLIDESEYPALGIQVPQELDKAKAAAHGITISDKNYEDPCVKEGTCLYNFYGCQTKCLNNYCENFDCIYKSNKTEIKSYKQFISILCEHVDKVAFKLKKEGKFKLYSEVNPEFLEHLQSCYSHLHTNGKFVSTMFPDCVVDQCITPFYAVVKNSSTTLYVSYIILILLSFIFV